MASNLIGGGSAFGGAPRYSGGETTGAGTKTNPYRISKRKGQDDTRSYQEQRADYARKRAQALVAAAEERRESGVGGTNEVLITVDKKTIRASPGFAALTQERYANTPLEPSVSEARVSTTLPRMKAFLRMQGTGYAARTLLRDPVIARRASKAPVAIPAPYSSSGLGLSANTDRGVYDPYTPSEYVRPVRTRVKSIGRTGLPLSRITGYEDVRTGMPATLRPSALSGFGGVAIASRTQIYSPERYKKVDRFLSRGGALGEFSSSALRPFITDPLRSGVLLGASVGGGQFVGGVSDKVGYYGGAKVAGVRGGVTALGAVRGAGRVYASTSSGTLPALAGAYPRETGAIAPFAVGFGVGYSRGFERSFSDRFYKPTVTTAMVDPSKTFNPRRQAGFGVPGDVGRRGQTQLLLTTSDTTPSRALVGDRGFVGGGASPDVLNSNLRVGSPGGSIGSQRSLFGGQPLSNYPYASGDLRLPSGVTYSYEYGGRNPRLVSIVRGGQTTLITSPQSTVKPISYPSYSRLSSGDKRIWTTGYSGLFPGRRAQTRSIFSSFSASNARGRFVQPSLFKAAVPSFSGSRSVGALTGRGFTVFPASLFGLGSILSTPSALRAVPRSVPGLRGVPRLQLSQRPLLSRTPITASTPRSSITSVLGQSSQASSDTRSSLLFIPSSPAKPYYPRTPPNIQPPTNNNPPPPSLTPGLPLPILFGLGTTTKERKKRGRNFRYETSLTAIWGGLSTSTIPDTITGGSLRPRINKRRKRK